MTETPSLAVCPHIHINAEETPTFEGDTEHPGNPEYKSFITLTCSECKKSYALEEWIN